MSDKPELGVPAMQDNAVEIAAGYASSIPIVGPIIATAIKDTIPNVRLERIEIYIKYLQDKIDELELKAALETPEGLDTFEEGMWQSARAFTDERKVHIADLVARGLKKEGTEQQKARHFLRILNQIDDRQIVLLAKYHPNFSSNADTPLAKVYRETHSEIVDPGISIKDILDHDGRAEADIGFQLNASMIGQLASLGLLEEDGDMDNVGTPLKSRRFHINEFGKDFLEYIGAV